MVIIGLRQEIKDGDIITYASIAQHVRRIVAGLFLRCTLAVYLLALVRNAVAKKLKPLPRRRPKKEGGGPAGTNKSFAPGLDHGSGCAAVGCKDAVRTESGCKRRSRLIKRAAMRGRAQQDRKRSLY